MVLTLENLVEIWGEPIGIGPIDLSDSIGPICTDSRKLCKGDFFVPLIGENFDGHQFLPQVFEKGAQGALVSRENKFKIPEKFMHWIVGNTLFAYQKLGLMHRSCFDIPLIAITGSVGKTTTKDILHAMLSTNGLILSSAGNNNNDIGVPLTLLQVNSRHAGIVIEMGMRARGEIDRLSNCTHPDIAVITNIGTAHLGRLGSREEIANAKCEITSSLSPTGLVIIPAGDPLLEEALSKQWKGRVVRIAIKDKFSSSHDFNLNLTQSNLVGVTDFSRGLIKIEGNFYQMPLEGIHNAQNFLLAFAVAKELGTPLEKLSKLTIETRPGRNSRVQLGGLTVLDETYNSSPEAVYAALDMLVNIPGRHFAVLGTMLELGDQSVDLHRQVANRVVNLGLDGLVIFSTGAEAQIMKDVTESLPRVDVVSSYEQASRTLNSWLRKGDVLLLKASRGIGLERLIPLLSET